MKYLKITILLLGVFGCGDGSEHSPISDEDMAAIDQVPDTADMSVVEPPKKSAGEPCSATSECERALICNAAQRICIDRGACLVDWLFGDPADLPSDEGCIVAHGLVGKASAKECDVDADCKGNPRSERCQFRICQDYDSCTRDADCEAPLLCIGEDERELMSVCAP